MKTVILSGWSLFNLLVVTEGDLQRLLNTTVRRGVAGRDLQLHGQYAVQMTETQADEVVRAMRWFGGQDVEMSGPLYNLGALGGTTPPTALPPSPPFEGQASHACGPGPP